MLKMKNVLSIFKRSEAKKAEEQVAKLEEARNELREWNIKLRREVRSMEKEVMKLEIEEKRAATAAKAAIQREDKNSAALLAREIVHARKTKNKLQANRSHLNAISGSLTQMIATMRVTGTMQQSAEIMNSVSKLMNVTETSRTIQQFQTEMIKMGVIEETISEAFEEAFENEELEEEVNNEVERLIDGLTAFLPTPCMEPIASATNEEYLQFSEAPQQPVAM
eukprot:Lankesteria_metandrocarpae@DN3669_c0_g1_i1.p1